MSACPPGDDGARLWLDDVLVADQWSMGAGQPLTVSVDNTRGAGAVVPIRVELREDADAAGLDLSWAPPGQALQAIPATVLSPAYGLVTSSTTSDSAPTAGLVSTQTTVTSYGVKPWEGLAQTTTVDPGGLNLATQVRYDSEHRRERRALPGGEVEDAALRYTDAYYADTELADNPCTITVVEAVNQAGRLLSNTSPRSADGRQLVRESVYDLTGRVVASRTGSRAADGTFAADAEGWTCTEFDARGRTVKVLAPDGLRSTLNASRATAQDLASPPEWPDLFEQALGQRPRTSTVHHPARES